VQLNAHLLWMYDVSTSILSLIAFGEVCNRIVLLKTIQKWFVFFSTTRISLSKRNGITASSGSNRN